MRTISKFKEIKKKLTDLFHNRFSDSDLHVMKDTNPSDKSRILKIMKETTEFRGIKHPNHSKCVHDESKLDKINMFFLSMGKIVKLCLSKQLSQSTVQSHSGSRNFTDTAFNIFCFRTPLWRQFFYPHLLRVVSKRIMGNMTHHQPTKRDLRCFYEADSRCS